MEWKKSRIGDCIQCNPTVKLEKGKEYPIIDIDKITVGRKYVTNKDTLIYSGQSGCKFQKGDTLMARITPCLENGKMAQAKVEDKGIGSTELFVFRGLNNITDNDYVYYFIKQQYIRDLAANSMSGASGRQRADMKFIKKIQFDLPPLSIQQKIASILSTYDTLIENNTKRIRLLEQMAENLYKEWFVRFRFPGYENVEMENGLPKGWKMEKLGHWGIELDTGSRPKGGIDDSISDGIPSLGAESIKGLAMFDYSSVKLVPIEFYNNLKRGKNTGNDILLYKDGAYIGKVTLFRDGFPFDNYSINEHVFFVSPKDVAYQNYLYFTLNQDTYFSLMQNLNRNAAQPGLSRPDINRIKINVPPIKIIEKFNIHVEPILRSIFKTAKQNQLLIRERDLLLPRLMSGKLEVKP